MTAPLVSILSLTCPGRERFRAWLEWNVAKQTYRNFEHVVVDGEGDVGEKRNRALELAKGDVIVWFDDDDWQHPERLSRSLLAMSGTGVRAPDIGAMVDAETGEAWTYGTGYPIFNGVAVRSDIAKAHRFGPGNESDGAWMHAITRGWKSWGWLPPNFAWLVHDANTVIRPRENPLKAVLSPGEAIAVYGAQAWGDTSERIAALREERAA